MYVHQSFRPETACVKTFSYQFRGFKQTTQTTPQDLTQLSKINVTVPIKSINTESVIGNILFSSYLMELTDFFENTPQF